MPLDKGCCSMEDVVYERTMFDKRCCWAEKDVCRRRCLTENVVWSGTLLERKCCST